MILTKLFKKIENILFVYQIKKSYA